MFQLQNWSNSAETVWIFLYYSQDDTIPKLNLDLVMLALLSQTAGLDATGENKPRNMWMMEGKLYRMSRNLQALACV